MIGKPEWFTRRKYSGWGLIPKTWQGWVYIAAVLLPLVVFNLFNWDITMRIAFLLVWGILLVADTLDIMAHLNRDERERMHEALAERNALWAIILVLVAGVGYQLLKNALQQTIYVDPFIIAALVIGLVVKAISNLYLDRKN